MDSIFLELERIAVMAVCGAATAFIAWAFGALREYLEIKESDSNEAEIRRAALTEAGKLVVQGQIMDGGAVDAAAAKLISDLHSAVIAERYDSKDIKDMIIGAAATIFPPSALLQQLLK